MKKSESVVELAKAMSKFQGEVKQPVKDGTNPHFKSNFVTLQGTVEAISKAASPNGLSFMQFPVNQDNKIGVYTLVMHSSGEWIESDPVFATPMKQDAQAAGSVVTYLKRYSLSAAFGIASDVDDDGEVSMNRGGQQQQQQQQQYPQQTYQQRQPTQQNYQNQQYPPQQNNPAPPMQQGSNMISDAQIKLVKTKLSIAANRDEQRMTEIFKGCLGNLGLDINLSSKDLTKQQASKVIDYLTNLAPQQ